VSRSCFIALALLVGLSGSATAQPPVPGEHAALSDVVVLPFANYSGRYEALQSVLPLFYERLDSLGLRVMSHEELRPVLREHRVRVVGQIGRTGMDVIATATGARLAIVGSIDIYEPDRSFEILINARLVDLQTGEVLTAVSAGKTVQETEKAFGRGRAERIEAVIAPVVEEFMTRMAPSLRGERPDRRQDHSCGQIVLVPLDDYSERRHGAEVLLNMMMTELISREWRVIEPGILREMLLDEQKTARGGITDEVLMMVRDQLRACFVVTGELEIFSITRSGIDVSVPRLGYGLRLIDVRSQRLLASIDLDRDGSDGETLFAHGREYSMARLARTSLRDVVTWIEEEGDR
jgi:hypothetical protein